MNYINHTIEMMLYSFMFNHCKNYAYYYSSINTFLCVFKHLLNLHMVQEPVKPAAYYEWLCE